MCSLNNIKSKSNNYALKRNKITHNKLAMCLNTNENKSSFLNIININTNNITNNDSVSKSFYEFIKQNNITLNNNEENYVENYITNFVDNYYKNNSQI